MTSRDDDAPFEALPSLASQPPPRNVHNAATAVGGEQASEKPPPPGVHDAPTTLGSLDDEVLATLRDKQRAADNPPANEVSGKRPAVRPEAPARAPGFGRLVLAALLGSAVTAAIMWSLLHHR